MNKSWHWNEERQVLNMKLRHSESDIEGLQTQLQGLTTRCQSAESESQKWKEKAVEQGQAYEEMSSSFSAAREEIIQLRRSLADSEGQVAQTRQALADSEGQVAQARQEIVNLGESRRREIDESVREAVREYRLSNNCYQRKEAYASCFSKLGFYLGRSLLESKRPGESFPEMVFSETASLDPPDWRKYEPNSCDPDEYIRGALVDDLSNLTGPWSPYVPDPVDDQEDTSGIIEALQTIRDGLDEPDGAPLSPLPPELEHFPPRRDD